jgi:hypothetical protein
MLYDRLGAVDGVPADLLAALRAQAVAGAVRGMRLTGELVRLLEAFRNRGIQALPFKGPLLAAQLYGDRALREFSDLDILVRTAARERAIATLVEMGYHNPDYGDRVLWFEEPNGERVMTRPDTGLTVDLHWDLLPDIWDRLRTRTVEGREVPVMGGEDLLLYLCTHGSRHRWTSLSLVCDVAQFLRVEAAIRWDEVERRARAAGSRRMLHLGLLLAHRLLQAPVPPELLAAANRDPVVRSLAAGAREALFGQSRGPVARLWFDLRVGQSWPDRCRCVALRFLSLVVLDRRKLSIGRRWSVLYYLLHPLRVLLWRGHACRRKLGQLAI